MGRPDTVPKATERTAATSTHPMKVMATSLPRTIRRLGRPGAVATISAASRAVRASGERARMASTCRRAPSRSVSVGRPNARTPALRTVSARGTAQRGLADSTANVCRGASNTRRASSQGPAPAGRPVTGGPRGSAFGLAGQGAPHRPAHDLHLRHDPAEGATALAHDGVPLVGGSQQAEGPGA